mmetsp:Transcript_61355/g.146110  ORF Transcript_61355/g.146110 Transcript_61355/m.146110 type:complete len:205 (+) Transcript_61355:439-1053(+)
MRDGRRPRDASKGGPDLDRRAGAEPLGRPEATCQPRQVRVRTRERGGPRRSSRGSRRPGAGQGVPELHSGTHEGRRAGDSGARRSGARGVRSRPRNLQGGRDGRVSTTQGGPARGRAGRRPGQANRTAERSRGRDGRYDARGPGKGRAHMGQSAGGGGRGRCGDLRRLLAPLRAGLRGPSTGSCHRVNDPVRGDSGGGGRLLSG